MSTPNPLVPLGSMPEQNKFRIRLTFFAIIALHAVLFGSMLIAGCNKTEPPPTDTANAFTNPTPVWPEATNPLPVITNPVVVTPPPPIPPPNITPPPPAPMENNPGGSVSEYTIVKGDTFATIGKKHKVGWKAIADANPGVDATRLKIGQKIKIPAPKNGGTAAPLAPDATGISAPAGGDRNYSVKSGDNLAKIAKANGVTLKALRSANSLKTDRIIVGQKLKIPSSAAPADTAPPIPTAAPVPLSAPSVPSPSGNQ